VEIDLFNSGPPLAGGGRGVGLANTRERLRQLYGAAAELALEDAPGGVRARLAVPLAVEERAP
jgi:sensor histidine kinase YesM